MVHGINSKPSRISHKILCLCYIQPLRIRRRSLVFQLAIHMNESSGLEHKFNKRLVTQPLYYTHYIYTNLQFTFTKATSGTALRISV
jgi:hypothetical protein